MTTSVKSVNRTRMKGIACTVGGMLFALSLVTMFSMAHLPSGVQLFMNQHQYILKTSFFLSQLGFMAGLAGLFSTNALGSKKIVTILLLFIPFAGQVFYAVSAWLPVQQVMTLLPLPLTQIGAMLNAFGMLCVGIVVIRAKVWQGWQRWVPLFVGLYPFLVMFPMLIISGGRPPSTIIGLWGLFWTILGLSVYSYAAKQTYAIA